MVSGDSPPVAYSEADGLVTMNNKVLTINNNQGKYELIHIDVVVKFTNSNYAGDPTNDDTTRISFKLLSCTLDPATTPWTIPTSLAGLRIGTDTENIVLSVLNVSWCTTTITLD